MVWWRLCAYRERRWAGLGDARGEGDAIWALSCGEGGAGQRFRGEQRSGARHGSFIAVARRRPSSACAQGGSAAWRGREASGAARDGRGESTTRGRRPDSTATTARQKTGEGRENREGREKERERN